MKKIFIALLLVAFLTPFAFADRNTSTIKGYSASELIKRGDAKVYRVSWYATSNGGSFGLYDTLGGVTVLSTTNVKTEGSEATALNGKQLDFTGKPLEFSTGLYIYVNNAVVTVEYE